MNERYLFRGKTKIYCNPEREEDVFEWVYGSLIEFPDGTRNICVKNMKDGSLQKYDVLPETVGQCTGLRDKNGKLIFEGDIAKFRRFENNYIGKIIFNHKTAGFEFWWNIVAGAYGEKATYTANLSVCDEIEVFGSVHDNPELLEVK